MIGKALNVSDRTISTDLRGLQPSCKPERPKGGRPKSSKPRKNESVSATPEIA